MHTCKMCVWVVLPCQASGAAASRPDLATPAARGRSWTATEPCNTTRSKQTVSQLCHPNDRADIVHFVQVNAAALMLKQARTTADIAGAHVSRPLSYFLSLLFLEPAELLTWRSSCAATPAISAYFQIDLLFGTSRTAHLAIFMRCHISLTLTCPQCR
jgi:hypothetical protein